MKAIHKTGKFQGAGGLSLYYQHWKVEDPKAVLVFIHGMAEHSDRYHYPVGYFSKRDFSIYAMDLRGHGESEGKRAYAERFGDFLEDIRLFLEKIKKENPKKKLFLIGHSFGGQLVLNYGVHFPKGLEGIIVSSPNISLKLKIPFIKRLMAPVLSSLIPTLTLKNEIDPSLVCHNLEVVEAYRTDPKVGRKITARLGDLVLANQQIIMDLALRFHTPCFLMHAGDDQICSPEGTKEFFDKIPIKDKMLKIYDGLYHELFNELEREKVFNDMENWLLKKI